MKREIYKVQHGGRTIGYVRQFRKDWGQFIGFHPSREIAEAELMSWAKTVYERLREVFA